MITAVDTNILIDIFSNDPVFAHTSADSLRQCIHDGTIVICEVVFVETATAFPDKKAFEKAIRSLPIQFSPMNEESADYASDIWRVYRQAGGSRKRLVADFLVAAHAKCQSDRLLTRDRGFYRSYFKNLNILSP